MRYIQGLFYAFSFKIGEYRFNSGNNSFNAISIWKIDEQADEMTTLQENTRINLEIQKLPLTYVNMEAVDPANTKPFGNLQLSFL
ncbi:hypothetical protein RirG_155470 [Rhizophagus irregularis DAOM 197198w]|uniref:Uncharacterized protein n=1 Tax=Rhizophagus irregularis (strain DAOM 197198w) TaxID=1432141 RepID=A0A015M8D3_RHIIW|nr:hypothetical protein RirG_155470 [Rhizophagus irregularis DAOM 197198w]